jgi:capsid portal protein
MSQNLIASKFQIEAFTSTIKGCFDALKFYKQRKLLAQTENNLMNENDTVADLNLVIRDLIDSREITNKYRACNSIKTALEKRLWSYIQKWRQVNLEY